MSSGGGCPWSRGVVSGGVWPGGVHPSRPTVTPPCEQNGLQAGVKTLPSRNFVCGRTKTRLNPYWTDFYHIYFDINFANENRNLHLGCSGIPMGTTILRTRYSDLRPNGPMSRRLSNSVVVMSVSVVMVLVPPVGGLDPRSSHRMDA